MSKNLNEAGKNNDKVCTPESIWQPWARVLGETYQAFFTLDPCGCEGQDEIALDTVYWPEDGLKVDWTGHFVWLNPPYSQLRSPSAYPWLVYAEEAELTVAFLPARTAAPWFRDAIAACTSAWFLDYRVTHKGSPSTAPFAQCFLQFGQRDPLPVPQELSGWGYVDDTFCMRKRGRS